MVPRWDSFVFTMCVFKCQQNSKEFCFPGNIDYSEYTKVYNYYSKKVIWAAFCSRAFRITLRWVLLFFNTIKILLTSSVFTKETFLLINSPSYNKLECVYIYLSIYLSINSCIYVQ